MKASMEKWFRKVIEHRSVEVSKPSLAKLIGWPDRPLEVRSLWTDYICWTHLSENDVTFDEKENFFFLCKKIFRVEVGKVHFDDIEVCRKRLEEAFGNPSAIETEA